MGAVKAHLEDSLQEVLDYLEDGNNHSLSILLEYAVFGVEHPELNAKELDLLLEQMTAQINYVRHLTREANK